MANPELNLGFDDPHGHRYFGNFGYSTLYKAPVSYILWDRLGATAMLAAIALAIIVPLSVVFGVLSGTREDSLIDKGLSLTGITLGSIPEFASAIFLMAIFAVWLDWLPGTSTLKPTREWSVVSQMVLPVFVLAMLWLGRIVATVRSSVIEMMATCPVQTESRVDSTHERMIWRNAILVSVRAILLKLPWLLTSIVVVEVIFAYPGLGRMLLESALFGDISMVEAVAVAAILILVTARFVGDAITIFLDREFALAGKSAPATETMAKISPSEPFRDATTRQRRPFLGSPIAFVGGALVMFWAIVAIFAPGIADYDPNMNDFAALADPTPGGVHLLGTDHMGRDMLSRLAWGARTVLTVASIAVLCAYALGGLMAMMAAFAGGWIETLIDFLADILLSLTALIVYIFVIMTFGPSALTVVVATAVVLSPSIGRSIHRLVLDSRGQESTGGAGIRGDGPYRIAVVTLFAEACTKTGVATAFIVVLGFLGICLPPPDPEWGGMVKDTTAMIIIWPHMMVLPSMAIFSLVIGFNLLAEGLRRTVARARTAA